jgi:hypothetical protein
MKKFLLLLVAFAGCIDESAPPDPLRVKPIESLLVFAIDPSEGFQEHLTRDPEENPKNGLYKFWEGTINNLFRQRIGHYDQMMIVPMQEGTDMALWQGTMLDFRESIKSSAELRSLIPQPYQVHPYQALAETIDYVLRVPGTESGPIFLIVMSKMVDDSDPEPLIDSLKRFREANGQIGFYWPDSRVLPKIDAIMMASGYGKPNWKAAENPEPLSFDNDE